MIAVPVYKLSLEEYLELDKNSEERYEYFDGEAFAMSGASLKHNQVISNFTGILRNHLEGRDCQVLPADMRLKVPAVFPYRYPDLVVVCGEPIIEELQGLELLDLPKPMTTDENSLPINPSKASANTCWWRKIARTLCSTFDRRTANGCGQKLEGWQAN